MSTFSFDQPHFFVKARVHASNVIYAFYEHLLPTRTYVVTYRVPLPHSVQHILSSRVLWICPVPIEPVLLIHLKLERFFRSYESFHVLAIAWVQREAFAAVVYPFQRPALYLHVFNDALRPPNVKEEENTSGTETPGHISHECGVVIRLPILVSVRAFARQE